ncbi:MAG: helix-turn-helix domain-containing protein [Chitinivibrionales bacterium]|nr:helix-turn-helix domain-containing protein [Chitinivibrionales bacterium]MBD3358218.1 helix-turn-helix domain-containing protein [Chitinivibrionales bacterium]
MPRISKNQLIKLQKKYRTDEAIGRLYNISRQAVHQLRRKYGIDPVTDKKEERNRHIVRLYNEGFGPTKLARMFGISVSQAYRIVHKE